MPFGKERETSVKPIQAEIHLKYFTENELIKKPVPIYLRLLLMPRILDSTPTSTALKIIRFV